MGNFRVHPLAVQAVQYFLSRYWCIDPSQLDKEPVLLIGLIVQVVKEVCGSQVCLWLEEKSGES